MKKTTLILAVSLALAACATEEQKPAATPAAKPAPASPAPAPAPVPRATQDIQIGQGGMAPKPEPKKPAVINLASTGLFEFDKATLTDTAKKTLDAEVVAKLKEVGEIRYINVNGHADRLGTATYNQKLSEKRADAVRAYLVSKGVDAKSVEDRKSVV